MPRKKRTVFDTAQGIAAAGGPKVTREEQLRAAIAGICEQLKGPRLSNLERLFLNEERRDMRAELSVLEAKK